MGESLYSFFMVDDKARWRPFLWSWLSGASAGTVSAFARASTQTIAGATLGTSFLSFGAFMLAYAYRGERPTPLRGRRAFIDFAYAGLAAAVFAAVQRLLGSPEVVHAASVNAVEAVRANQPVSPVYLATIDSRIETLLKRGGQPQAIRRELVADHARAKAMLAFLESSETDGNAYPSPDSKLYTVAFAPPQPGGTMFSFPQSKITFIGGIFTSTSTANSLAGGNVGGVAFVHSIVKSFSQKLDGITWIDVRFEECLIEYDGGPLLLVDVVFADCSFKIVNLVPTPLRNAITESTTPITISSDYPV
jgi:hypothetical protein